MASIGKYNNPLKTASILSLFSRPCLRARSPLKPLPTTRTRISSSRWGGGASRTFMNSAILNEKKYTKDHEWVELSPDGKIGTIGITTYAAKALGDVVYVELPTLDLEIAAGDTIGAVESVKSASDILTPVSGKVCAANEALEGRPGVLNEGPEGEGWIARIEIKEGGGGEVEALMDGEAYRAFTEE